MEWFEVIETQQGLQDKVPILLAGAPQDNQFLGRFFYKLLEASCLCTSQI